MSSSEQRSSRVVPNKPLVPTRTAKRLCSRHSGGVRRLWCISLHSRVRSSMSPRRLQFPSIPSRGKASSTGFERSFAAPAMLLRRRSPKTGVGTSYVKDQESSYLVGASSDVDQAGPREWTIQIHRERSLKDKLFGRSRLADNDAVSARIEAFVRESSGAQNVYVERGA